MANRDLNRYSGGHPDRLDCGRSADVSQVLARGRTAVAVGANPRAISQMANVHSNNPPGMEATSAAPATPNSSSRLPAAKHAYPMKPQAASQRGTSAVRKSRAQ